jgi:hypothetical protein
MMPFFYSCVTGNEIMSARGDESSLVVRNRLYRTQDRRNLGAGGAEAATAHADLVRVPYVSASALAVEIGGVPCWQTCK